MRFNVLMGMLLLAGSVAAETAGEVFEANRTNILARAVSVIGETVFTVGKAKSDDRLGTAVGLDKAAMFAYDNLDRLNYDRAEWPADMTSHEKSLAWNLYRVEHPFELKVAGGFRVYEKKTGPGLYLVVIAFPKSKVWLPRVSAAELKPVISQARSKSAAGKKANPTNSVQQIQEPKQVVPTSYGIEMLDDELMF